MESKFIELTKGIYNITSILYVEKPTREKHLIDIKFVESKGFSINNYQNTLVLQYKTSEERDADYEILRKALLEKE